MPFFFCCTVRRRSHVSLLLARDSLKGCRLLPAVQIPTWYAADVPLCLPVESEECLSALDARMLHNETSMLATDYLYTDVGYGNDYMLQSVLFQSMTLSPNMVSRVIYRWILWISRIACCTSLFCESISDIRCRSCIRIDAIKPISTIKIKYPTNTLYRKFI